MPSQILREEKSRSDAGADGRQLATLIVATLVSALGGFLFRYDNIVISGAIKYLSAAFRLDEAGVGWAAACALVGCLAGSMVAGWLADHIGLKKSLGICQACFAGSSLGVFFSSSLSQFVVWRMLGGAGIGTASILSLMYITEIAPTQVRGRAMSVAIASLWLFAYLGNQLFPIMQKRLGNSGTFWCISAAVLLNMLYVLFFVPETKGRSLEDIEKLRIK